MNDIHDKETRSYNMSMIKGKNTKPEIIVRKYLYSQGHRYRLHRKDLPGNPDIVLTKYNLVIFVNGCFWHAHENCKNFKLPRTRTEWWEKKLSDNKERDKNNIQLLINLGWRVHVIWECQLKTSVLDNTLQTLTQIMTDK